MKGLPDNVVTDQNGNYSATVPYGFSGTVVPAKEGYAFEPASRAYTRVASGQASQDYIPRIVTLLITGSTGLSGVEMNGLPDNPVTGNDGTYKATVAYGWSGTVTPQKEGYTFEPVSMSYSRVKAGQTNRDYDAKPIVLTISGAGVAGARMVGLPGNVVTDQRGYYSATVPYGWSGTVTPTKEGFRFSPQSRLYRNVVADQTNNKFTAAGASYAISGAVAQEGVVMKGLPGLPITGQDGKYKASVEYGWSGTVTPTKEGYVFDPPHLQYSNVKGNQFNQDFWPTRAGHASMLGRTGRRKVLVVPAGEVKAEDLVAITEDMQVMSHILDERFKETRRIQGVFTDFGDFFGRDSRATEATYLQGYGVLFLMEVNFAFSPPPKARRQEAGQTAERVDSTWRRAQQEVFSPGDPRRSIGSDPAKEYDSQMVEELKRDLITALKHAANMRGVQPDEWIILTVIGGGRQSGGVFGGGGGFMMGGMGMSGGSRYGGTSSGGMGGFGGGYSISGGSSGFGGGGTAGGVRGGMMGGMGGGMGGGGMGGGKGSMTGPGEMGVSPATVLTIRAKKSDVDAFAKGEQDYELFRRMVQIFTY
jgi:hypothetical protein